MTLQILKRKIKTPPNALGLFIIVTQTSWAIGLQVSILFGSFFRMGINLRKKIIELEFMFQIINLKS